MQFLTRCVSSIVSNNRCINPRTILSNVQIVRPCSSFSPDTKIDFTKKRKKKDLSGLNLPEKPKKPATTFIRFLTSVRSSILEGNPNLPVPEVMRYAAHLWNNTDIQTRTKFQVQYYADLEKYLDDMQKYHASLTEEQSMALRTVQMQKRENRYRKLVREKLKDLEKPKRPLNAFTLFLVSKQYELRNVAATEYCHQLAEQWKQLPEKEKNVFRRKSKKLQSAYYKQLAEWKERVGPMNIMQALRSGNLETAKQYLNENVSLNDEKLSESSKTDES